MSLFDRLVSEALQNQGELAPLRVVVEKELLHHDILREMKAASLLEDLTFIGGTCLRACYGSYRLSEDLDFAGGKEFTRETLTDLSSILVAADMNHAEFRGRSFALLRMTQGGRRSLRITFLLAVSIFAGSS